VVIDSLHDVGVRETSILEEIVLLSRKSQAPKLAPEFRGIRIAGSNAALFAARIFGQSVGVRRIPSLASWRPRRPRLLMLIVRVVGADGDVLRKRVHR